MDIEHDHKLGFMSKNGKIELVAYLFLIMLNELDLVELGASVKLFDQKGMWH